MLSFESLPVSKPQGYAVLSQARIDWEGCSRKGIQCKNGGILGLMEVDDVVPTWIVGVYASCYPP